MKKIKRSLTVVLILGLSAPFVAFGAYNDVTLTTNAIITVAGINLNVSGSSAVVQSITVNANDFSFTLLPSSQIQFTSTDRRSFGGTSGTSAEFRRVSTCSDTESVTTYFPVSAAANTITVSPSASACTTDTTTSTGSSGSSSGRGGGGGGGTTLPITPATPAPALQALAVAAPQAAFNRSLSMGSTGDDVRNLQTRLLSEGFFKAQVTGYFGPLTQAAVKAYQAKYGIDQLGIVGPATRAQLNANANVGTIVSGQLTPTQVSAIMSQINLLLQQVQALQAKLKALSN